MEVFQLYETEMIQFEAGASKARPALPLCLPWAAHRWTKAVSSWGSGVALPVHTLSLLTLDFPQGWGKHQCTLETKMEEPWELGTHPPASVLCLFLHATAPGFVGAPPSLWNLGTTRVRLVG